MILDDYTVIILMLFVTGYKSNIEYTFKKLKKISNDHAYSKVTSLLKHTYTMWSCIRGSMWDFRSGWGKTGFALFDSFTPN